MNAGCTELSLDFPMMNWIRSSDVCYNRHEQKPAALFGVIPVSSVALLIIGANQFTLVLAVDAVLQ